MYTFLNKKDASLVINVIYSCCVHFPVGNFQNKWLNVTLHFDQSGIRVHYMLGIMQLGVTFYFKSNLDLLIINQNCKIKYHLFANIFPKTRSIICILISETTQYTICLPYSYTITILAYMYTKEFKQIVI